MVNKPHGQLYCCNSVYHCHPYYENMVPVHKIVYAVTMLASLVLKTRQWLEKCLQYTNHQAVTQRSEIEFRLYAAAAETKYLAHELTFLGIVVNHTTGTADQVEMLIDVYDVCFRRFKKIMKSVRWIEMLRSEGKHDNDS
uniref:Uncharacterized protein n=1 Tax=Schizaphis graminum TaxID=13262 RepID=A0A2S2P4V3_SCHGA